MDCKLDVLGRFWLFWHVIWIYGGPIAHEWNQTRSENISHCDVTANAKRKRKVVALPKNRIPRKRCLFRFRVNATCKQWQIFTCCWFKMPWYCDCAPIPKVAKCEILDIGKSWSVCSKKRADRSAIELRILPNSPLVKLFWLFWHVKTSGQNIFFFDFVNLTLSLLHVWTTLCFANFAIGNISSHYTLISVT